MDYKDYVKELKEMCEVYLNEVELVGNENAYTDSLLENVFTSVERLKDFYDKTDINREEDEVVVVRSMDELREYLDKNGWQISECSFGGGHTGWEIGQSSPAGEDFWFSFEHDNDVETAVNELQRYAYNFDVDEHVQLNLGARGAPDVTTLVEDAHAIQEMLDDLADGVNWCEQKTIGETLAEATERSVETNNCALGDREVGLD